jgi:hypothetical protein
MCGALYAPAATCVSGCIAPPENGTAHRFRNPLLSK